MCFRPANGFPEPPLPHNSVSAADGSTQLASPFPRPSAPSAAAGGEGRPGLLAAPAPQPLLDSETRARCLPPIARAVLLMLPLSSQPREGDSLVSLSPGTQGTFTADGGDAGGSEQSYQTVPREDSLLGRLQED